MINCFQNLLFFNCNLRLYSMGGDLVEVSAKPRNGGARVEADVRDAGDGTYALTVVLDEAVAHDIFVTVNALSAGGRPFTLLPHPLSRI